MYNPHTHGSLFPLHKQRQQVMRACGAAVQHFLLTAAKLICTCAGANAGRAHMAARSRELPFSVIWSALRNALAPVPSPPVYPRTIGGECKYRYTLYRRMRTMRAKPFERELYTNLLAGVRTKCVRARMLTICLMRLPVWCKANMSWCRCRRHHHVDTPRWCALSQRYVLEYVPPSIFETSRPRAHVAIDYTHIYTYIYSSRMR